MDFSRVPEVPSKSNCSSIVQHACLTSNCYALLFCALQSPSMKFHRERRTTLRTRKTVGCPILWSRGGVRPSPAGKCWIFFSTFRTPLPSLSTVLRSYFTILLLGFCGWYESWADGSAYFHFPSRSWWLLFAEASATKMGRLLVASVSVISLTLKISNKCWALVSSIRDCTVISPSLYPEEKSSGPQRTYFRLSRDVPWVSLNTWKKFPVRQTQMDAGRRHGNPLLVMAGQNPKMSKL